MNDSTNSGRSCVTLIIDILEYDGRWRVRVQENVYSEYPDKERARLDALEAAADARQRGHDAEVWDRSTDERLL